MSTDISIRRQEWPSGLREEPLREALIEREMSAERRINFLRIGVIAFGTVADLAYAWAAGTLSTRLLVSGTGFGIAFVVYVLAVHRLTGDGRYRPWLKYVTVSLDYALMAGIFAEYHRLGFFGDRGGASGAAEVSFLILLNFASAFRHSRVIIVYSTVLATGAAIALVAAFSDSTVLLVYSPLAVLGSGWLTLLLSSRLKSMFVELRRREHLLRFLPGEIVREIDAGRIELRLGGVKREATILLSDLRDFTAFAENRDPDAVVAMLNEHFTEMTRVVRQHGGAIDKFMGDGILAVFGLPVSKPDDAARAVEAGMAMQAALDTLNARRQARGIPSLRMGIALHTGIVVAGIVGSPERMEYTVIGDAVNVVQRIEELNKTYGTDLLLSETTQERVAPRIPTALVAEAEIRGRQRPVRLFTPLSRVGEAVPAA